MNQTNTKEISKRAYGNLMEFFNDLKKNIAARAQKRTSLPAIALKRVSGTKVRFRSNIIKKI